MQITAADKALAAAIAEAHPLEPSGAAEPTFLVDGCPVSLGELLAAHADDEALCAWARAAQVGDMYPSMVSCMHVGSGRAWRIEAEWPGGGFGYTLNFPTSSDAARWGMQRAKPYPGAVVKVRPQVEWTYEEGRARYPQDLHKDAFTDAARGWMDAREEAYALADRQYDRMKNSGVLRERELAYLEREGPQFPSIWGEVK
jgi:hypothetical protein